MVGKYLLASLIVFLTITSNVTAQSNRTDVDVDTPGLRIEAVAGWDGTVDRSTSIPISMLISNDSDQTIEGKLTLSDPATRRSVSLGEIVVGPSTTRRFSTIQALQSWYECVATLTHDGTVLWRRELVLDTGNEFRGSFNFALFIDYGKKLDLPGGVANPDPNANRRRRNQIAIAPVGGSQIRSLTVPPWQIPNHPDPLNVAQTIVIPDKMDHHELNRAQWRAISTWMCQGGAVFVHKDNSKVIQQLAKSAPLDVGNGFESDGFTVRPVGLGAIYEYPHPLFTGPESSALRTQIGKVASRERKNLDNPVIRTGFHSDRGGRADINRIFVVVLFLLYGLFAGVGSMLMFRVSRRRVAIYTVIVVSSASVMAVMLGGYLRFSKGELRWTTVTQLGARGAIQTAQIEIQSAGGRGKRVAVNGNDPDLQVMEGANYYYRWHWAGRNTPLTAFSWQPNLAKGIDDTYQVSAAITPWGRRRLQAVSFDRELPRMGFELDFTPWQPNAGAQAQSAGEIVGGTFSVKITNNLPFDLTECYLVIAATRAAKPKPGTLPVQLGQVVNGNNNNSQPPIPQEVLVDVYHTKALPPLSAGKTYEEEFHGNLAAITDDTQMMKWGERHWLRLPRMSRLGDAKAWIVGRVAKSPVIAIDQGLSDFVDGDEFHAVVQEIRPSDMPDPSVFVRRTQSAKEPPANP